MQAKILEFNEQVGSHKVIFLSSYHFFFLSIYLIKIKKLNEQELAVLLEIIDTLKAVSRYHASKFYERHHNLVWKLLLWPEQQRFPSKILKEEKEKRNVNSKKKKKTKIIVLDLLRLLVLHPHAAATFASTPDRFVSAILNASSFNSPDTASKFIQNNNIAAFRVFANLFKHSDSRSIVLKTKEQVSFFFSFLLSLFFFSSLFYLFVVCFFFFFFIL